MALKQLVEVEEKFPTLKRARLGAAPPVEDVLDNVGSPELSVAATPQPPKPANQPQELADGDTPRTKAGAKKRDATTKRAGQGIHKGSGTDARRYRKTGRTFPWGVRVHPDMAERVKVMAGGPMIAVKRMSARMSHTCGCAIAAGLTVSKGMPIDSLRASSRR